MNRRFFKILYLWKLTAFEYHTFIRSRFRENGRRDQKRGIWIFPGCLITQIYSERIGFQKWSYDVLNFRVFVHRAGTFGLGSDSYGVHTLIYRSIVAARVFHVELRQVEREPLSLRVEWLLFSFGGGLWLFLPAIVDSRSALLFH